MLGSNSDIACAIITKIKISVMSFCESFVDASIFRRACVASESVTQSQCKVNWTRESYYTLLAYSQVLLQIWMWVGLRNGAPDLEPAEISTAEISAVEPATTIKPAVVSTTESTTQEVS